MKYIWRIFIRDLENATKNVIGIVVLMGLVIVPAMYAWFNIAGSWDPYGNTKNLKVAVVNSDKGYKSDLVPVTINVGNTVESTLRSNKQLDWQFQDQKAAVDGVYSGKYYAAIIIPTTFSKDMMTLFSPHAHRAKLIYYINQKSNAIVPHITDQGADTIVTQIDSTFSKTLANVALDLAQSLSHYAKVGNLDSYISKAITNVDTSASGLKTAAQQMKAYSQLLASSASLLTSAQDLMQSTGHEANNLADSLSSTVSSATSLKSALKTSAAAMDAALQAGQKSLDSVASQIDSLSEGVSSATHQVSQETQALSTKVSSQASAYTNAANSLQKLRDSIAAAPSHGTSDSSSLNSLTEAARSRLEGALDAQISQLRSLAADHANLALLVRQVGTSLQKTDSTLASQKAAMKQQIAKTQSGLQSARTQFRTTVEPQLDKLSASLSRVFASTRTLSQDLSKAGRQVSNLNKSTAASLASVQKSLNSSSRHLDQAARRLRRLSSTLKKDGSQGLLATMKSSKQTNAAMVATLLSQPVVLSRQAVFPVENYGSQMAPFYTILAIWVGSVILVAMMEVKISDKGKADALRLKEIPVFASGKPLRPQTPGNMKSFGLRLDHEYFGRYLIFLLLALAQATLIAMGDLWYLKIQCRDPGRFFAVCWLCALTFSSMMYALTVSFGAAGKAIAVILLVMQVAGTGGTFPIQMLPKPFQVIFPLFPFPYGITAMRAAIAGSYQNEFTVSMVQLSLFILVALFIGIVLRRPFVLLTTWFTNKVDSTKVY